MASGYIEYSNSTGVSFSTSYVMVAMTTPADAPALVLPTSGVQWSFVEILLKDSTINQTNIDVFLSWDSLGIYKITTPNDSMNISLHTVTSTEEYAGTVIDLGIVPTFPVSNPAGKTLPARGTVHLWIKGDNGTTDNIILARLHWHELSKG